MLTISNISGFAIICTLVSVLIFIFTPMTNWTNFEALQEKLKVDRMAQVGACTTALAVIGLIGTIFLAYQLHHAEVVITQAGIVIETESHPREGQTTVHTSDAVYQVGSLLSVPPRSVVVIKRQKFADDAYAELCVTTPKQPNVPKCGTLLNDN